MDSLPSRPIASDAGSTRPRDGSNHRRRIVIVGAAGRDFHNFNVVYRNDPTANVVAFTAAQIPGVAGRRYPRPLAGDLYPEGIEIVAEAELERLCAVHHVDQVVFAYSDVPHEYVMHVASRTLATGADFVLLGPNRTMLNSKLPVIAVTAVRTGCGKSAVARWLSRHLRDRGKRVAVLRHPMPYGDLARERAQRFASLSDLEMNHCTIEEREEYEPHIAAGNTVFAGVDYTDILQMAEQEAEVIIWDGGNNDFPFVRPDLQITVADALRPHQVTTHHPGEAVARMADVFVINKVNSAPTIDVAVLTGALRAVNPGAPIVLAASPIRLDDPAAVKGRRVLVIEDGPTITHGGMRYGAGYLAAVEAGALVVDPRPWATGALNDVFATYPHIGSVLPALGYQKAQLDILESTINSADVDLVIIATPADLTRLLHIEKKTIRARYEFAEAGTPTLSEIVDEFLDRLAHAGSRS
jgi:predicted GTPase